MPIDEIVDISRTRTRRRRQFLLRVGVPLLGVALVILSILGISLYSYQANRAGALTLSNAVLDQLQARIAREVSGYLSPATQAALIARDMVARNAIPDGRTAIEGFAASMLNQVPHLEGFYAADADGNFIMVRRNPAGGTDTKLILNIPGNRLVSSVHLDDKGRVLDHTLDPGDDFDPRSRVWYQGALKTDGVFWSQPYIFYTTQAPGVTAAIRFQRSGRADRVFGVDITLEALSGFLAGLPVGRTGRAAIVDSDGEIIAAPELAALTKAANSKGSATKTADSPQAAGDPPRGHPERLGDPALVAAYDRYRIEGYGHRTIMVGGRPFVTIASRLPAASQNWVLLIAAPEKDFTAFAQNNSRENLLLSLITIGLASLLGFFLVRQNRRTDRVANLLAHQRETAARETRALSALVAQPDLFDPHHQAPGLTEHLVEISAARRASIWRLAGQGRILRCDDSFDPQQGGHVEGLELSRSELPRFFDALEQGQAIEVADAAADARTAEFYRLLMQPAGNRALSVLPVQRGEATAGAVLLEDAPEAAQARNFTQAVSSIVAMRIGADPGDKPAPAADERPAETAAPEAIGSMAFSSLLTPQGLEPSGLAARFFPHIAAMIIRFDDSVSLGLPDHTGIVTVADAIAKAIQAIGMQYALPYMKVTGHHLVAAAGCSPKPDSTAAVRLADAAVAAREQCLTLLSQSGLEPSFRIGIDFGAALGGELGADPRLFNLWGDVIRNAELMAHSAIDSGSIQVTEAAFEQLRRQFLFRARGMFYLPRAGTARTFILAGRR